jgi:hypothetical protein|tara:strand:- start:325 stop:1203 length:879 start_codon:yes stop_codon:yes gene_type:complete
MKANKNLDTLVDDIYNIISALPNNKQIEITDEQLDLFGKEMAAALKHWSTPQVVGKKGKPALRMSNIGKPSRQLWFDVNSKVPHENSRPPSLYIKFLYGHLLEVLMLFFVRLSGHSIDSEQKQITVSGIKGHMDCKIDGEVVDVKTASGYAFKKFQDGSLAENDSFGYLSQLAGYEEAEGTSNGGFLVMNKETGELVFHRPQDLDKPNIKNRIKNIKSDVKKETPPDLCYPTVPEGKSGNMKLPKDCSWCIHKFECHKDSNNGEGLKVFRYAKGNVYLTNINKIPNVEEVII